MPAISPVRVSCTSSTARETPKSVSLTRPSSAMSTLPGFTSRCTTPAEWAAASPSATCCPMAATSAGGSRPRSPSAPASDRDGRYSITSQGRSSCTTTSNMLITCGWRSRAPIRPSRRIRCRDSSSASASPAVLDTAADSSSLTATVRFSSSSVPRQTAPMAPTPIRSSKRYRSPMRVVGGSAGRFIMSRVATRPPGHGAGGTDSSIIEIPVCAGQRGRLGLSRSRLPAGGQGHVSVDPPGRPPSGRDVDPASTGMSGVRRSRPESTMPLATPSR